MKRALITGITGQDGAYLAKFLLDKGYQVFGTYRRTSTPNFWRLSYLDIFPKVKLIPIDLTDHGSLCEALAVSRPDELYHLAAQSFVEASFQAPVATAEITGVSVASLLDAVLANSPDSKFYFAATSELYGDNETHMGGLLNEDSPFRPASPYAAAKLYGHWTTEIYRKAYALFACSGILFNHESPIRGLEFVTRRISNAVARAALGLSKTISLGNIDAMRDWGYAPEYVEAMWMMLQSDEPSNYVVATGSKYSVRQFLEVVCKEAGINPEDYLKIDKTLIRPLDVPSLVGDHSKITRELGWRPRTDMHQLARIMYRAEKDRWERHLRGETFPWDAPTYPDSSKMVRRQGRTNGKKTSR